MSTTAATPAPARVLSVDAFRGFVLLLMMAEVMQLWTITRHLEWEIFGFNFWDQVRFHTTHVEWGNCSLHDLIQPAFSFLVGVSLPFSIAQRESRGQSFGRMLGHAAWRSVLLIALGIFLRSVGRTQTNWMFTDTLGQIGLGYTFLFLLAYVSRSNGPVAWLTLLAAFVVLLVAYWGLFAAHPLPPDDFDYRTVGVSEEWRQQHSYEGFLAHWNKNTNPAMEFDKWWLNQFPREKEFLYEGGGYATLSFIPTLATMILGLLAGSWLRRDWPAYGKLGLFALVGLTGIALGLGLEYFEICPVVKRIWTPAWVLYSGGWTFLLLAGFYLVIDVVGFWHWSFPLMVLGANSIVAYCATGLTKRFIITNLRVHLGEDTFRYFGAEWEQQLLGAATLVVLWLMLFWMYRNKIFVRI